MSALANAELAPERLELELTESVFLDEDNDTTTMFKTLKRIGVPEDIAPMVTFLASAGASWVTGQVISVNGGFSMV